MNFNFPNKPARASEPSGFTLIEVLIAMVMLTVISLAIFQATTTTYHLRDTLLHEGDFHNGVRLAVGILERDFSQLYSPSLLLPQATPSSSPSNAPATPPPTPAGNAQQAADDANVQPTLFWGPIIDKTGIRETRFKGTATRLSFIAVSHIRVYKDVPESEFNKVIYELQPDKVPTDDPTFEPSGVLVKTSSPNAFSEDDDKDTMKHVYRLIRGVKTLKFRYLKRGKDGNADTWSDEWDSVEKAENKGAYPDMIEMKLEVTGPSRLRLEGTYNLRTEIPILGIQPSS